METLEVRREYTLSRRPVHPRTPRKHTFTPRGNLAKSPVQEFGRNWRTRRKPIWTQDERDILYPILGFNWGLWSCESAMLPTAPPCRPDLNLMFITYCIFSALSFISDFYLFGILLFFFTKAVLTYTMYKSSPCAASIVELNTKFQTSKVVLQHILHTFQSQIN